METLEFHAMNLEDEINLNEDGDEENEERLKNSSTDYGKIASAIGKMKTRGLSFSLPNINISDITFSPDLENNRILYGLRGITRIGNQLIKDIIKNRPYSSIEDFITKVKVNKIQMISLIKAGVFDEIYECGRQQIMNKYLDLIADKKKRITLQNMQMLITKNLIPENLNYEIKLFNFNKYLKKHKSDIYYELDEIAMEFYLNNYNEDLLINVIVDNAEKGYIKQSDWDSIYKKGMDPVRIWMKKNQQEILNTLNQSLLDDVAEKYTEGSISKWEMDSLNFYYHDHELENLQKYIYNVTDWSLIPDEPPIENMFHSKEGKEIPIYKLYRIAGTVIDKDKNKGNVILLTTDGVITVKVWKSQFTVWDKQISERDSEGVKHVIEKSWFTRGNKLIITGIKRDGCFIPKKYKNTEFPLFEKILNIDEKGFIESVTQRPEVEE